MDTPWFILVARCAVVFGLLLLAGVLLLHQRLHGGVRD